MKQGEQPYLPVEIIIGIREEPNLWGEYTIHDEMMDMLRHAFKAGQLSPITDEGAEGYIQKILEREKQLRKDV